MIVRENSEFAAARCADFPEVEGEHMFRTASFTNLVVEPGGRMAMPPTHVTTGTSGDYRIHGSWITLPDGKLPAFVDFPKMMLTSLENAYCLPFGPPILLSQRQIITDFLVPWGLGILAGFAHSGGKAYHATGNFETDDIQYDLDTAIYMDHSISGHYGHFIGDCLCRLHAWDVCRALFGDVKVIIADGIERSFQTPLLNAAGVPTQDIIKISGLVRCRRLLLATQSLGVEQYASPTSSRLWGTIRDRHAVRDVSMPDRIYLSRSGIKYRKLLNETGVERVFERHGFLTLRPESFSVKEQIELVSNALLVAGPGGSGMFNLAFQGRMRSAFILMCEERVQLSEMLFCAGRSCGLWYHLGQRASSETSQIERDSWVVDLARLESDVADWVAKAIL